MGGRTGIAFERPRPSIPIVEIFEPDPAQIRRWVHDAKAARGAQPTDKCLGNTFFVEQAFPRPVRPITHIRIVVIPAVRCLDHFEDERPRSWRAALLASSGEADNAAPPLLADQRRLPRSDLQIRAVGRRLHKRQEGCAIDDGWLFGEEHRVSPGIQP